VLTATARPSTADELWVHELIGLAVEDRHGNLLGTVHAVQANPASDLLVLDHDVLVPLTFLVERRADRLVVDPPEGLLEL
jgi:ribosomal 30S subunit maturation factor RimM